MKQEFGLYYLRFAWLPKKLDSGAKIWFKHYYEVHFDLPFVDPVYTISRISTVDYLVESLRGTIENGRCTDWGFTVTAERMLNATNTLLSPKARPDEELH